MAITYVGGTSGGRTGNTNATTTQSLTGLTGGAASAPAEGDLVIVCCAVGSQGRNPAQAISGYTTLGTQLNATAVTYDTSMQVSWKFMTSTPDTSITIPAQGNIADGQAWAVQVFRGVDTTTPFDPSSVQATGTATGRPDPAAITPANSGAWIVIAGAAAAAATTTAFTAPTDFSTNFVQNTGADTNDARAAMGYYTGWTSGSYNPAQFTGGTTGANDSWAAWTMALKPGPTPVNLDGTGTALTLTGGTATLSATATQSFDVAAFSIASTTYSPTVSTAAGGYSLDGTGTALALTGGTATLSHTANVSLTATGTALALSGGNALFGLTLPASSSALALTGGTATLDVATGASLDGTGSALALTGGTATLSYTANVALDATGSQVTLTGGTAGLTAGDNKALVGSGVAMALAGGNATLTATDNIWLSATGSLVSLVGGNATLEKTDNLSLEGLGGAIALTGGEATLVADVDIFLSGEGSALSLVGGNASLDVSAQETSGGGGGFTRITKADTKKAKDWLRRRSAKPISLKGRAGRISLRGGECAFYSSRPTFVPNLEALRPPLKVRPKSAKPLPVVEIDYAAIEAKRAAIKMKARRKRDEEFLLFIA